MAERRVLILLPTYNERENLPAVAAQLLAQPGLSVLVIDDGSPDGTGQLADELAAASGGRLSVLHRTGRRGLGRSYLDGMRAALASDAELVFQMDADLSHDPKYVPDLIAAAARYDVVIGSRYLQGVSVVNWPLRRLILSTFANWYVRTITGMRVRDCTAGFRCWRREAIARLPLDRIVSDGYSFQVETLFLALEAGATVGEVPIIFVERRVGASKISGGVIRESFFTPWRMALRRLFGHRRSETPRYNPPTS
ncbi:MAG: polyprenol monophosphomannose synthase [Vicinamibacterales bacterium]